MRAHAEVGCQLRFVGGPMDGERGLLLGDQEIPDPWKVLRPPPRKDALIADALVLGPDVSLGDDRPDDLLQGEYRIKAQASMSSTVGSLSPTVPHRAIRVVYEWVQR